MVTIILLRFAVRKTVTNIHINSKFEYKKFKVSQLTKIVCKSFSKSSLIKEIVFFNKINIIL